MKNIRPQPRVHFSLSLPELVSVWSLLKGGKLLARPDDRKRVQAVLARMGKGLTKLGLPSEAIDKLVKL